MSRFRFALLAALFLATAAGAHAQNTNRKITGEIVRVESGLLVVRTASSAESKVKLTPDTRVSVRAQSDLAHVKEGSYVGATAAPRADGTLVASEVHIFPEALRGTGEGHRPMEGSNTMTNATVGNVSGGGAAKSTMTNATVGTVSGAAGERRLTLNYAGGSKVIVVPSATPVMTTDRGDASALVPRAHVIVFAAPDADGALRAERISVGKDGYVPPI